MKSGMLPVPGGMPYCFVGALGVRWDAGTGLHYMRNRWYAPGLGRFVSRDPLGKLNTYSYTDNQPATFIDPFGMVKNLPQILRFEVYKNIRKHTNEFGVTLGEQNDWYKVIRCIIYREGFNFNTGIRDDPFVVQIQPHGDVKEALVNDVSASAIHDRYYNPEKGDVDYVGLFQIDVSLHKAEIIAAARSLRVGGNYRDAALNAQVQIAVGVGILAKALMNRKNRVDPTDIVDLRRLGGTFDSCTSPEFADCMRSNLTQ